MKIKLKKAIVGIVLATAIMLPTVASAAYGYLTDGVSGQYSYASYGWADYQYHTVYVRLTKCGQTTPYQGNWQTTNSAYIYGLDSNSYVEAYSS